MIEQLRQSGVERTDVANPDESLETAVACGAVAARVITSSIAAAEDLALPEEAVIPANNSAATNGLIPIELLDVQVDVGIGSPIPVNVQVAGSWPGLCAQLAAVEQQDSDARLTRVTGVRLHESAALAADLVVDASGQVDRARGWLRQLAERPATAHTPLLIEVDGPSRPAVTSSPVDWE